MSITQDMSIPEIVEKYPQTQEIFKKYGLRVDGYKALEHENLFATSRVHQIDLQKILHELNQSISA
jgi:iron-sulfur cluster repair protein YtfE (RIC family)